MRDGTDKIRIKQGYEFKLIARLIEDGILPFEPKPITTDDLREWNDEGYTKYLEVCNRKNIKGIQDRAWNEFLKYGAIGCYWSFGSGKSLFGHRAIGCVKGPKLVVVPSIILGEQWLERLNLFNPSAKNEVTVVTYHGFEKVCKQKWALVIFDEHQHLPANSFMKFSTISTKYRLGFSGSPFREDGRESYIFALTGFPVGMSWEELLQLNVMDVPQFRVYVLRDKKSKDAKIDELMRLPLKTIIFCDSVDYGEELSKRLNIPFVYGGTSDRLEIIRNNQACIVSRVGDEGLSDLQLQRVLEVAFLFGSRMQESQRFGRLMHSKETKTQHIILMTRQEFELYQKRLMAITERGFKIELIQEGL
jgi:DNA excision repair protein ERCC-3